MPESFDDQLGRVRGMSEGDPTWDLSPNDQAALKAVLTELGRRAQRIDELQLFIYRGVRGLKHCGSFKRTCGEDPHPLDCTLAGRVSHVFGVGMTTAIQLCLDGDQDAEWKSDPCQSFDDHDWEHDEEDDTAVCRRCGTRDSVDVMEIPDAG